MSTLEKDLESVTDTQLEVFFARKIEIYENFEVKVLENKIFAVKTF